jgi:hypothetical protein
VAAEDAVTAQLLVDGAYPRHGPLTADATEPEWNGYLLTVACLCGVVFARWVTPEDAELDLLRLACLNQSPPGRAMAAVLQQIRRPAR